MQSIKEIITIISACMGLLATVTGFLIPLVKNVKAKNKLSALNKLAATLQSLIVDAEQLADLSGAEKKEYVLNKASGYAINNDIPFDRQLVSDKIEEIVALSKKVNATTNNKFTNK